MKDVRFYDTNRTINRDCHLHSYRDATKIGDSTCFMYTRKPRCNLYRDVYQSVDGHLCRSGFLLWDSLFLVRYPLVIVFRALSHILFATLGAFFLQKISKDS